MGRMNSSSEIGRRVLAANSKVTTRTARKFLEELANTSDDAVALQRFEKRFRELFREQIPWEIVDGWARIGEELDYEVLADTEMLRRYWLIPLRDAVRTVW